MTIAIRGASPSALPIVIASPRQRLAQRRITKDLLLRVVCKQCTQTALRGEPAIPNAPRPTLKFGAHAHTTILPLCSPLHPVIRVPTLLTITDASVCATRGVT